MFQIRRKQSLLGGAFQMAELVFHESVRSIRSKHRNPIIGILLSILQMLLLVAVFYVMFTVLGMRRNAVRGDFLLYIMTGIYLFQTHVKAITGIAGTAGPTSGMMNHAPMNTYVAMAATALSTLYIQVLALVVVLFIYNAAVTPIEIYDPYAALSMVILAWFSGCCIGTVFLALKPWFPNFTPVATSMYTRANMIASGKMFLANTLPGYMLAMFDWNPLFHTIDQARGFVFINYYPHFSNLTYPILFSLVVLIIGLLGESYTRRHTSLSWFAAR